MLRKVLNNPKSPLYLLAFGFFLYAVGFTMKALGI